MTGAPENLLAVRRLLLTHLNVDPDTTRAADLDPGEVGIVGNADHRGGYHCGSDRVVTGDYSVVESPRDRTGLTLDAAALDVGMFEVTVDGRTYDLPHFSAWCVGQCKAGAADTRDIREIIWSPDGRTVRRWDRLGKRSSGDDSHRWHTHFSFHRDAIKAGRDQQPLFRRYLTTIGLIEAPTPEDDVTVADARTAVAGLFDEAAQRSTPTGRALADDLYAVIRAAMRGVDMADEPAIVTGVLAGLTPQAIAAAIPPDIAEQVADEITRRLAA